MKIERMNKGSWGKVRAFFDLATSDGFIIKGFKLIEGINGLFVSMPSQKGNDDDPKAQPLSIRDANRRQSTLTGRKG